ncbi:hypothetical protein HDU76_005207, partial [Blyttiomyces sp. JEL0837]
MGAFGFLNPVGIELQKSSNQYVPFLHLKLPDFAECNPEGDYGNTVGQDHAVDHVCQLWYIINLQLVDISVEVSSNLDDYRLMYFAAVEMDLMGSFGKLLLPEFATK